MKSIDDLFDDAFNSLLCESRSRHSPTLAKITCASYKIHSFQSTNLGVLELSVYYY